MPEKVTAVEQVTHHHGPQDDYADGHDQVDTSSQDQVVLEAALLDPDDDRVGAGQAEEDEYSVDQEVLGTEVALLWWCHG